MTEHVAMKLNNTPRADQGRGRCAQCCGGPAGLCLDTTGWLASSDFTDGLHPNEQGSGKAAQALVTAINKIKLP